ncbi:MAG: TPM domain-containing protein [Lachnospiraceae bacterium]|nr:TPM domain-containing protein [Lachnospiraceae bacterium]
MKFFKKIGVAITTLVLSIATAVTIGQIKGNDYDQPEPSSIQRMIKEYGDEDGFAELTEICDKFVVDNANVIDSAATKEIVNIIANMAVRDEGVVAVATETFAEGAVTTPEDLAKTAERIYDRLGLEAGDGAVMLIDTTSENYYFFEPESKVFNDMSEAEIKSVSAALQSGFEKVRNGDADGISDGVREAYDAISRIISDPSAFANLQSSYVQENDEGGYNIVEKTVNGGMKVVSGIVKTATGLVSTVFKFVGRSSIFVVLLIGGIIILVKSSKKKNKYSNNGQNSQKWSGQGGKAGGGRNPGQPGQPGGFKRKSYNSGQAGRNLSQSGNIDTSKISTQGSQYRWSANKNPYSGLNKGKSNYNDSANAGNNNYGSPANAGNNNNGGPANAGNNNYVGPANAGNGNRNNSESGIKDMSGFVFPSDFSPSSGDGQEYNPADRR